MTAESDLYALLSGNAGVNAQVGTRIYPDAMPEDAVYPSIVYARAATTPILAISGQQLGAFVQFAATAWANTRATADAAASALEAAAASAGHEINNREAGFDAEIGLYASTVTFTALST